MDPPSLKNLELHVTKLLFLKKFQRNRQGDWDVSPADLIEIRGSFALTQQWWQLNVTLFYG